MTQQVLSVSSWLAKFHPNENVLYSRRQLMQQYADYLVSAASKDSAVGFGEWLGEKCESISTDKWYYWPEGSTQYTTAQLYEIYEQSKIKG